MPTISFSYSDICKLVGRKLSDEKLEYLLSYAKAEVEDKTGDELTVQLNDTNLPYLWTVEGIARLLRGIVGKEKGLPKYNVKKSKHSIVVDRHAAKVRPHIACFIAYGKKIDEYLLKQLIQLQEKLAESFGQNRKKISVGVYPLEKISFPVGFKAVDPKSKFIPLDFHDSMSLKKVLKEHPKGVDYGHILDGAELYPVFMDSDKSILSLVPVINSEETGRLEVGSSALFFDTTGTDERAVNLVANIFATTLLDRGFTVESLTIKYPNRSVVTPTLRTQKIRIKKDDAESLIGISLKESDLKSSIEKMRCGYSKGIVTLPPYRDDVMHPVDIYEDIAIAFGYDNLKALPLTTFTRGKATPITFLSNRSRDLVVGLGYQEVLSPLLSNKVTMVEKMNSSFDLVEIENSMSQTYSAVRSNILPVLLDVLSKNKHVEFPQKIFEEGEVSRRKKDSVWDERHIAALSAHAGASFTEAKQAVEHVLRSMNVSFDVDECDSPWFVPGRGAEVFVNKKSVGYFGEIHPEVLENFGLQMPAAGFELNLSELE